MLSAYHRAKLLAKHFAAIRALRFPKDDVEPTWNQAAILFAAIPIEHSAVPGQAVVRQGSLFYAFQVKNAATYPVGNRSKMIGQADLLAVQGLAGASFQDNFSSFRNLGLGWKAVWQPRSSAVAAETIAPENVILVSVAFSGNASQNFCLEVT